MSFLRGFDIVKVSLFLVAMCVSIVAAMLITSPAHAAVTQVSTGETTACAVTDLKVKCWGNNTSGQLGNRTRDNATKPVAVDTKAAWVESRDGYCAGGTVFGACIGLWVVADKVTHQKSALRGEAVKKVSVGTDHACALASARVFCWGNNSNGELGNSTTTDSTIPVAVDYKDKWTETIPAYCDGRANAATGCAAPTGTWVAEKKINHMASALKNKEVVDISAGEDFTCALASDGSVACWGKGSDGRLGNNATTDSSVPVAVYSQAGSTQTTTVTVNAQTGEEVKTCLRPSDNAKREAERQACLAERGAMQTREETRVTTIPPAGLFGKRGIQLAKASGKTMCVITKDASLDTAGTPYCWGNGIDDGTGTPTNGSTTTRCTKDSPTASPSATSTTIILNSSKPMPVTGATIASMDGDAYVTGLGVDGKAYYWGQYGYKQSTTYTNIKTCKVNPCTGKVVIQQEDRANIVLARNTGVRTETRKDGKVTSSSGKLGNGRGNTTKRFEGGTWTERTVTSKSNREEDQCSVPRTHYAFTKNTVNTTVGQRTTTTPPSWPQSQAGIAVVSGNVYEGLFCAVVSGSARCDAHGGNTKFGQLGNGSTAQLAGPQSVITNGWLAGKQVKELSTGKVGYTCALANGGVGCWGVNNKGQLGVGDTVNKNVPTGVGL